MNRRGLPLIWSLLRGLTLLVKVMCLLLRLMQDGVEVVLLQTRAAQAGEKQPTALSPLLGLVAGAALQQEAQTLMCPRMELSPGERRNLLVGSLMSNLHPKVGVINPKHLMAGAIVEEAITRGIGQNQMRAKRVPQTLPGKEIQQPGRKIHEAGDHQLPDLGIREPEEMEAGESQSPSAQVDHLKAGQANLMIVIVGVVQVELWDPGEDLAQRSRLEAGVAVSRSPLLSPQAGKSLLLRQSDVKWR